MYGGRFGDTKIRNVDGEPSHVNNIEADGTACSRLNFYGRPFT